jgi:hypothetical protein
MFNSDKIYYLLVAGDVIFEPLCMMKHVFFYSCGFLLVLASCRVLKRTGGKPGFYGNWVLSSLIDSVERTHSLKRLPQFIFSEMLIPATGKTITFINGDMSVWTSPYTVSKAKTLDAPGMMKIPHSALFIDANNHLCYFDSALQQRVIYSRVSPDVKRNPAGYAQFELINKMLFEGKYESLPAKNTVEFAEGQKVKGWNDFDRYEFYINSDMASTSEENLISMEGNKKLALFIYRFRGDTLKLFEAKNTECAECKPFYVRGKLVMQLVKDRR